MGNVRRWYVYLVCAVTIQAVTWAAMNLLRNLTIVSTEPTAIAFQISVIIIGLPLYLAHWIWAQRQDIFTKMQSAMIEGDPGAEEVLFLKQGTPADILHTNSL